MDDKKQRISESLKQRIASLLSEIEEINDSIDQVNKASFPSNIDVYDQMKSYEVRHIDGYDRTLVCPPKGVVLNKEQKKIVSSYFAEVEKLNGRFYYDPKIEVVCTEIKYIEGLI